MSQIVFWLAAVWIGVNIGLPLGAWWATRSRDGEPRMVTWQRRRKYKW